MPTYRTTTRNQFRTPSGAVGEAPDGPGALAALADDLDDYLGVGGAEYCANAAAATAIPVGRRFLGKLIYRADLDTVFRYVGAGNTTGPAGPNTWQAWEKPGTAYTPAWGGAISGTAPNVNVGFYGITNGRVWIECLAAWNGGAMTLAGGSDATVSVPSTLNAGLFSGTGTFFAAGSTAAGSDVALTVFAPNGGATNLARVRAFSPTAAAYAAGIPIRPQYLGNIGIVPATSDSIMVQASGPSASTI